MKKSENRKKLNLTISESLLKSLILEIVDKYGNSSRHISETVEEAIKMWLEKQRDLKKK